MALAPSTLAPHDAWQPLPAAEWNEAAARHLLQRAGFTATPEELARTLRDGPLATARRFFAAMPAFPVPTAIAALEEDSPAMYRKLRSLPPAERREAARAARERSRAALRDMELAWLNLAANPAQSPAEKWLLFLSDVWVVSVEKVKNSALVFQHQDILRRHALGRAPDLAKAVSRSPAMIVYLDLQQNRKDAPNENFARELFELFTLGEGHYTEHDIKEAARAFTGYRQVAGKFAFAERQHDAGVKSVFGQSGRLSGDEVIELAFRQPAARTFLPRELVRFYLTDVPLPEARLAALGDRWAESDFDLRSLATTFFSSREFFAAAHRGNFIKSPVQYYLGLLQDLNLQVPPLPRPVLGALRQMGQLPFDPPNVRGWVGGRAWINSATLAVRRQVVNGLLNPPERKLLNADEAAALDRAGPVQFTLDPSRLDAWCQLPAGPLADELVGRFATGRAAELRSPLEAFVGPAPRSVSTVKAALAALLDSPAYHLC